MFIVFDLDGTLALTEHRSHHLQNDPKDWRGFYAACDRDAPCWPIINTMESLIACGHDVEIWSGRSDEVWQPTFDWFVRHGVTLPTILMRAEGDHTPDDRLKKQWLDACGRKPDLVFEDRARMVAMFRGEGIVVAQVAPGDF